MDVKDDTEEDAAELRLGGFEDCQALSNAEVAVLLRVTKEKYEKQGKPIKEEFRKTFNCVKRFSGADVGGAGGDFEKVVQLREQLQRQTFQVEVEGTGEIREMKLEPFEIAMLSNLFPESVEEAVTLLPSLSKRFSEDDVEGILKTLRLSGIGGA